MIRRSVFTLILSLGIAVTAAAETSERTNELALGELSTTSAEEIPKRLITKSYTFTEAQFRAPAVPNNVVELALNEVGSGSAAEMSFAIRHKIWLSSGTCVLARPRLVKGSG